MSCTGPKCKAPPCMQLTCWAQDPARFRPRSKPPANQQLWRQRSRCSAVTPGSLHRHGPLHPIRDALGGRCATLAAVLLLLQPMGAGASSIDEIKDAVQQDFVQRQYYVTGQLTRSLYEPDCRFVDPTTDVKGVEPYTRAVATLFDPAESRADLVDIAVTDSQTITLHWRLEGKLRLGGLRIKPYTGTTRYTVDSNGLISSHQEDWDISAVDAFVSTLFPSFGAPPAPPVSH